MLSARSLLKTAASTPAGGGPRAPMMPSGATNMVSDIAEVCVDAAGPSEQMYVFFSELKVFCKQAKKKPVA